MKISGKRKQIEAYSRKNWRIVMQKMRKAYDGAIIIREFLIVDSKRGGVMLYHGPSGRFRTWPSEAKSQMIKDMKASDKFDKELIMLIWE